MAVRLLLCVLSLCILRARAEEKCGAEVKLLLLPGEVRSAVRSFHAGMGARGEVYFFDTPTLDLWSQGIIVRMRRSITADLTVKVRQSNDKEIQGVSGPNARFKCELDLTGGAAVVSHSIQTKFKGAVPQNGNEVFEMLSSAQRHLIDQVHSSVDWNRVRRIAEIKSTDWKIYNQPPFPKLVLELWRWPTGSVLELSTKVAYEAATTAYSDLQRLAAEKQLSPSNKQTSKTALALGDIAHAKVE